MMNTPVSDFVEKYNNDGFVRLHVPGHKGKGSLCEANDLTEIDGADVLYHEDGILQLSQKNASRLFGTARTVFSAEGSSLCIRAMLALVKMYAVSSRRRPVIAAARNAHKVFMTASALLDIDVRWIYPENGSELISSDITAVQIDKFLSEANEKIDAVYITSPDYLGKLSDIKEISYVCKKHNALLLADNAHGAYLKFLPEDIHPIALGADMCCDSAHKTFSVLTGGAYLHISENAPEIIRENAVKCMSLFASTSPSYLILRSLDMMNKELETDYREQLNGIIRKLFALKEELCNKGFTLSGDEALKLTIDCKKYGYKGTEIAEILRKNKIECEFSDPDFCVMMFTHRNTEDELQKLRSVLLSIEKKAEISEKAPVISKGEQALSVKDALFMPSEKIDIAQALGRILASPSVSCPPAIPIAVCGERLTDETVAAFKYYGVEKIDVIKE